MPLMMDNDMNVSMDELHDELFGDQTASLLLEGHSLPSQPPTKELRQRVDDLRGSGCCQSIAWSKWGTVASIAANGNSLVLQSLRCDPADGSWALSEPSNTAPISNDVDLHLKHLAWSPSGSDLAVVDSAGRVTILTMFSSVNKPSMSTNIQSDPVDDLQRVVGCYWLNSQTVPPQRPVILHGPAIKENKDGMMYRYEAIQAAVLGPAHPQHSKGAFVYVTTNGSLRVMWQQNTGKWHESHTELESIVSSDDLITHASICSDKAGILLIAFATTSKQLRTVRAVIDWGVPKTSDKNAPSNPTLNPSVKTRHLAVTSWLPNIASDDVASLEQSMVQLSHLEFLSPVIESSGRTVVPPTIVATRSYLPTPTSYNQDVRTVVDKWEVREKPQSIHPSFEQLSSRRNSSGTQPGAVVYLKKAESFTIPKVIVSIHAMNLGKVLFFAYSDGSVSYRDRTTMLETFSDNNLDKVWHLSQIGFTYSQDEPCLQVTLSPSYCSIIQIGNDGKVKWKQLDYRNGEIGTSMDENGVYAAVIAAVALSYSTAIMSNVNCDDLLATVHKHKAANSNFAYDWLLDLARILKANVDYSEETHYDLLIRNTIIQLCLSIQQSLGFRGELKSRTFSGKLAWIVLQLRNIVVFVTMAANIKVKGVSPLEDAELIKAIAGSVNWVLNLMAWVVDSLFQLKKEMPSSINLSDPDALSLPALFNYLREKNNITLHLLLSSSTRSFLTAICRRLSHLEYVARKAIIVTTTNKHNENSQGPDAHNGQSVSPQLRNAYLQIATLSSESIVQVKTFENLLLSLNSQVKTAYASHNLSGPSPGAESKRNKIEMKMLLGGDVPDAFKPVIVELFRKEGLLDNVRVEIDPAKLFFADFSILEADEDEWSVERRKVNNQTVDSFRKRWLPNPKKSDAVDPNSPNAKPVTKWRRCVRCAAVMEEPDKNHTLQWFVMQQRRCYCSGYWCILEPGKSVA